MVVVPSTPLRPMRRFQYTDLNLRKSIIGTTGADYAIHEEDTYMSENRFDIIVIRSVYSQGSAADFRALAVAVSRTCEERLRETGGGRYFDSLVHMYTTAGQQGVPNTLWTSAHVVHGALRPPCTPPISPRTMIAYLILTAPTGGVHLKRRKHPDPTHTLQPGDIILCGSKNGLEIVKDEADVSVCYLMTAKDADPPSPVPRSPASGLYVHSSPTTKKRSLAYHNSLPSSPAARRLFPTPSAAASPRKARSEEASPSRPSVKRSISSPDSTYTPVAGAVPQAKEFGYSEIRHRSELRLRSDVDAARSAPASYKRRKPLELSIEPLSASSDLLVLATVATMSMVPAWSPWSSAPSSGIDLLTPSIELPPSSSADIFATPSLFDVLPTHDATRPMSIPAGSPAEPPQSPLGKGDDVSQISLPSPQLTPTDDNALHLELGPSLDAKVLRFHARMGDISREMSAPFGGMCALARDNALGLDLGGGDEGTGLGAGICMAKEPLFLACESDAE